MSWLLGIEGTQLFPPWLLVSPGEIPSTEVTTSLNFVLVVTQLLCVCVCVCVSYHIYECLNDILVSFLVVSELCENDIKVCLVFWG